MREVGRLCILSGAVMVFVMLCVEDGDRVTCGELGVPPRMGERV